MAERDAEHAARASALQAEVKRLERELLGRKSEKLKIPPADSDLGEEAPDEEELARRREETARKRRENAIIKQNALAKEEVDHKVPEDQKRCSKRQHEFQDRFSAGTS